MEFEENDLSVEERNLVKSYYFCIFKSYYLLT